MRNLILIARVMIPRVKAIPFLFLVKSGLQFWLVKSTVFIIRKVVFYPQRAFYYHLGLKLEKVLDENLLPYEFKYTFAIYDHIECTFFFCLFIYLLFVNRYIFELKRDTTDVLERG
jgi:hypothetical protein